VRGWLEQIPSSHPAVTARPGETSYGLVHYACSIEEAVATEYSDDEKPVYRRWKPSSDDATGRGEPPEASISFDMPTDQESRSAGPRAAPRVDP
jgi:hypothetical protein